MATNLTLTWSQFNELRLLFDAIRHSADAGAEEGELKNTIVDGEWTASSVEITLDF